MIASPWEDGDLLLSPEFQERNRDIAVQRLGWPDEAVSNCRQIEAKYPEWYCWWTLTPWPRRDGPAYGAARIHRRPVEANLYAATPAELAALIEAKEAQQKATWPPHG